ncbi:malonic semialdehyde reductase [Candidatus Pseudothioglobus singularis]|jgi:3-hydroxypropanoate dehydrogenase|nr:malonic semialdehyde reductase [Gammaproteobacteria bacterium]MBT5407560.1 malonic semialdehyde reductase [Gammaproteobacteria bacterium]MBT8008894.1 malonic semialdehyde reductase [Gammaproteobacteria bacterium]MDC0910571.1 malonic semialdehyde reductase [Candidatus Pseudothioglobus singularis]
MLSTDNTDILFSKARSHKAWLDQDINDNQIQQIYNLLKFAPTSGNCCPARFTFVRSEESKQKMLPSLDQGNIDKVMSAPCVVIISYDTKFYESLSILSPHNDAKASFEGKENKIKNTAKFNSSLQGAYFIIATRSVGLDCCPMLGFNKEKLNQEFFPDKKNKAIFICGIGYGDESKLRPRAPRLDFEEACNIL